MPNIEKLQERWNNLYKVHLPGLAKARDPVQNRWPVQLDHCFARIILDNAVGVDRPWTAVLKSPAYKNMTQSQLEDAIDLGERLATGQADLVELDERSLELRGKRSKKTPDKAAETKRKAQDSTDGRKKARPYTVSEYFTSDTSKRVKKDPSPSPPPSTLPEKPSVDRKNPISGETYPSDPPLDLISASTKLTPFRKQVLRLLTQVPRGQHTTYAAMAAHISSTSHNTCARAVGSAMRNNPFAPVVPCHRVLAADGRIGGFGGDWGEEGKHAAIKKKMLREEGVKFDGTGRVVGKVFVGFEGDGKA